jgi:hypothetical protein
MVFKSKMLGLWRQSSIYSRPWHKMEVSGHLHALNKLIPKKQHPPPPRTEHSGRVLDTPALYSGGTELKSQPGDQLS